MKKHRILLLFISFLFISESSFACSALLVKKDAMLLGKNFDWYSGQGLIIKNNRGVKKTAYGIDSDHVVSWTSKYGSITFNQIGKEFPYGGINEQGLAIEMLWYADSHYPENGKPTISELEWIQYQLDNYKTAAEVQYYVDSININPINATLHFIVADKDGRSCVIDFVEGKAVVSNTTEPFQVLTNSNYLGALNYYENHKDKVDQESRKSADRFCQLTSKANSRNAQKIDGMFKILKESAEDQKHYKTYWSIVYDLKEQVIHFNSYDSKRVKIIDLNSMDFDKTAPVYSMDINLDFVHLKPLTSEMNEKLLNGALDQAKIKLNRKTANAHMMNPRKFIMDDTYAKHHKDLTIEFDVKKEKGYLFYTLLKGEENYKKFKGEKSAMVKVYRPSVKRVHYSLPKGEYALAVFHDLNSNFKMDKFIGIPSEPTGFSNGAKATFGLPKYSKVVFDSFAKPTQTVSIK